MYKIKVTKNNSIEKGSISKAVIVYRAAIIRLYFPELYSPGVLTSHPNLVINIPPRIRETDKKKKNVLHPKQF